MLEVVIKREGGYRNASRRHSLELRSMSPFNIPRARSTLDKEEEATDNKATDSKTTGDKKKKEKKKREEEEKKNKEKKKKKEEGEKKKKEEKEKEKEGEKVTFNTLDYKATSDEFKLRFRA